jgi:translation initiation factor 2 subunit 3
MKQANEKLISEMNLGLTGHVDTGKTTLTKALSGKWTDVHSEEIKRGITIRLGYADFTIYKCLKGDHLTTKKYCISHKSDCEPLRTISLIDAPGHETLTANMISGAAVMDGALLLVAANEKCPQPQTIQHLMALEIAGIKNIVIVQNKIDLVSKERALENYHEILNFVRGTIAEEAPIIPISAEIELNIDILLEAIQENIPTPKKDINESPLMYVIRSFDVNKPGTSIENLIGGVIGGSLKCGMLKKGMTIQLRPGIRTDKGFKIINTEIVNLKQSNFDVQECKAGGLISIETKLDPAFTKSDSCTGNLVGIPDKMPPVLKELDLEVFLVEKFLENAPGFKGFRLNDPLMLNIGSTKTSGIITKLSKNFMHVNLTLPVCASEKDKAVLSARVGNNFRLVGYGIIEG